MQERSLAEKIRLVNIVLIAICAPLAVFCVVQGLWFPAFVFAFLTLSNGVQLRSGQRPGGGGPS